ncbi:hypothetical protein Tco_1322051 [Tanacetum coccineum]
MANTRSGMTHAAIEEMIDQRVNASLEVHQVNQNLELRNGNNNGNDNGNGNGNNNGNGLHQLSNHNFKEPKEWFGSDIGGWRRWRLFFTSATVPEEISGEVCN